jgi:hypothetical protein
MSPPRSIAKIAGMTRLALPVSAASVLVVAEAGNAEAIGYPLIIIDLATIVDQRPSERESSRA